jgi:oligopeptide/dipeptide ABC transporter ATP-binding protein
MPPHHPYTEALLSAVPGPAVETKKIRLAGNIPSATDPPRGCVFHMRCPRVIEDVCQTLPHACAYEFQEAFLLSGRLPAVPFAEILLPPVEALQPFDDTAASW